MYVYPFSGKKGEERIAGFVGELLMEMWYAGKMIAVIALSEEWVWCQCEV